MVWSNWKIALALVVIGGGLAWSQMPRSSQPASSTDRIMTVHENGKAIRCRVVTTWRLEDGALAYQLQALDTGEMLTIVEDAVAAAKQGIKTGSKAKARPMRIFHWGRGKTPPTGTPVPPMIIPASAQHTPTAMTPSSEHIITWEEKPAAPVVVPSRKPAVVTAPAVRPKAAQPSQTIPPVVVRTEAAPPAKTYSSPFFNSSACPPAAACETMPAQGNTHVTTLPGRMAKEEGKVLWVKEVDPDTGKVIEGKKPPVAPSGDGQVLWIKEVDPVTGQVIEPAKTAKPAPKKTHDRWTQKASPRPTVAQPIAQNPAPKPVVVAPPVRKNEPFTTAAPMNAPTIQKPSASTLGIADKAPAKEPAPAAAPVAAAAPPAPPKQDLPWRTTWGKGNTPKTQDPGLPPLPPASVTEKNKEDILLNPERIASKGSTAPGVPAAQAALPTTTTPGNPQMPGQWPLGAQSVLAAKNGMMNGTTFVPVPVATVPNPLRLPAPPAPKMPEPPAPNNWVNAFSPPAKQQQEQLQMQAMANQQMGVPNMMPMNPYAMQGMGNPYMMALGMPGYQHTPHAQPVGSLMPMNAQRMPLNYMANYPGPGAPNPVQGQMQQPVMTAAYQQPAFRPAYVQPVALQTPQPQANSAAIYLQQLLAVLRESPYPAQREWAANTMCTYDWRTHPQIVEALIQAARQDPAATVRAGCVYSLSRLGADLEPIHTTFQTMRHDADPRVRQEAEQALARTSKQ